MSLEIDLIQQIVEDSARVFENFFNSIPEQYAFFAKLILLTLLITIYAVFIWKFYKLLARRELISLNLGGYNTSEHPFFSKLFAVLLFFAEYILILPFLVFFWFVILSIFLLLLSRQGVSAVLFISAALIASVRIASYISEELSKDLSKMFPFTILALFLLDPSLFVFKDLINRFLQIPFLLSQILGFLGFIFIVEIVLRGIYTIIEMIYSRKETKMK